MKTPGSEASVSKVRPRGLSEAYGRGKTKANMILNLSVTLTRLSEGVKKLHFLTGPRPRNARQVPVAS